MSPSKYSLSKFVTQFNVALRGKTVCFAVDFNKINFRILEIFKKEGLISSFHFNFEEHANNEALPGYIAAPEKQEWGEARDYTKMIAKINSPRYLRRYYKGDRSMEYNGNDLFEHFGECYLHDGFVHERLEAKNKRIMKRIFGPDSDEKYRLADMDFAFMHKLTILYQSIQEASDIKRCVWVKDEGTHFSFEDASEFTENNNGFFWEDLAGNFLRLRRLMLRPERIMAAKPILLPFDPERIDDMFVYVLDVLIALEFHILETASISESTGQAQLVNIPKHHVILEPRTPGRQQCIYDKLYVFPKYYSGEPYVKRIKLYGINDTFQYVSREELVTVQQMHGFQSLFIVSTPDGVIASTFSMLEASSKLQKRTKLLEGGLLLLRADM